MFTGLGFRVYGARYTTTLLPHLSLTRAQSPNYASDWTSWATSCLLNHFCPVVETSTLRQRCGAFSKSSSNMLEGSAQPTYYHHLSLGSVRTHCTNSLATRKQDAKLRFYKTATDVSSATWDSAVGEDAWGSRLSVSGLTAPARFTTESAANWTAEVNPVTTGTP